MNLRIRNKFLRPVLGGVIASFVFGVQPTWSAIGPVMAPTPGLMQEPAVAAALPNGLLLSVERMIQTRWDAIKIATVSVPDSSAELVAQKLLALRALNDFAQTTVGGLVNASDGQGEHSEIKKQLIDLQVRWNLKITDAVNALLEHAKELHGGSEFVSSRDALVVK